MSDPETPLLGRPDRTGFLKGGLKDIMKVVHYVICNERVNDFSWLEHLNFGGDLLFKDVPVGSAEVPSHLDGGLWAGISL